MKIIFLGTGGAFATDDYNYNSNLLIYNNENDMLLYDAGFDIKNSLNSLNISVDNISNIFISHLHGDHAGGVEYIGFKQMFDSNSIRKINLISTKEILEKGWKQSWSGSMEDINIVATLETYFNTVYLDENEYFYFNSIKIELIKNTHVVTNKTKLPSYGIAFSSTKKIYISGDTSFEINKLKLFFDYDILFHECSFSKETSPVHTSFNDLKTLPNTVKKKMWLYHYTLDEQTLNDIKKLAEINGFAGVVDRGQEFTF